MPLPILLDAAGEQLLFTPEQAARMLAISPRTLRQWALRRQVPCTRMGKLYRFTADHLKAIIDLREQRVLRTVRRAA